jgi:hypothetical protein
VHDACHSVWLVEDAAATENKKLKSFRENATSIMDTKFSTRRGVYPQNWRIQAYLKVFEGPERSSKALTRRFLRYSSRCT